jgi:hypothetical protein
MSFLSPFSENFNNDEIFPLNGDFNYFNDPFNLRGFSIFNELDEFKNDIFNTSFIDNDYNINNVNNENNADNVNNVNNVNNDNNINDNEPNTNYGEIIRIVSSSNNKKNEETAFSSKDKTTNSTKSLSKPKMNNKAKLGRKRKDEINNEDIDNVNIHTKEKPDNIRVRYKRIFFANLISSLNKLLKESQNPKLNSLEFKKLNSDFIKSLKKDVIVEMLNSPAYKVLSQKIAKKYKTFDEYHNREIINLIYKENEESLINILSKSARELIRAFCGNTDDDLLLKNYRLEDSIKKLSKKESKDYIEKLKNEAKHFEETFIKISGRNRALKKDKKNYN